MRKFLGIIAAASVAFTAQVATAEEPPIKIGLVMTYSGPFATYGHQADLGVDTFLKANGNMIAGRKIEIIRKDDTGLAPDVAKRMAQELAVRDKVDFILGGCWSPNALASADVVTEAKIPFFILVAATSGIPAKSPFFVRNSFSTAQTSYIMAKWSIKKGYKKGYNALADYVLGIAAGQTFKKEMEAEGGEVVGEVRMAPGIPEYTPYMQRIKEAKPDIIQLVLPSGDQAVTFVKTYAAMGLLKDGIHLLAADVTEKGSVLELGDFMVGTYNISWYESYATNPENQKFVSSYKQVTSGDADPGFVSLNTYDALNMVKFAVEAQQGKTDGEKTMALVRGHHFMTPRGEIAIDAKTGEIAEDFHIREIVKDNDKTAFKELETFHLVRDPNLPAE